MNTSSPQSQVPAESGASVDSCPSWCTEHDGETCMSRVWSIGGFAIGLSGHAGEPTAVDVDHPDGGGASTLEAARRLSDALCALAMLGRHRDHPQGTEHWTGRLDELERSDDGEAAVS